jgi:hypothetical protein
VRGRYTAPAGASYVFEKNTRFYVDFLYGYGLRKGFSNTEKLPGYNPLNLGVEHVFHAKFGAIRELKLRFDCINVFDEVYRLRRGHRARHLRFAVRPPPHLFSRAVRPLVRQKGPKTI